MLYTRHTNRTKGLWLQDRHGKINKDNSDFKQPTNVQRRKFAMLLFDITAITKSPFLCTIFCPKKNRVCLHFNDHRSYHTPATIWFTATTVSPFQQVRLVTIPEGTARFLAPVKHTLGPHHTSHSDQFRARLVPVGTGSHSRERRRLVEILTPANLPRRGDHVRMGQPLHPSLIVASSSAQQQRTKPRLAASRSPWQ